MFHSGAVTPQTSRCCVPTLLPCVYVLLHNLISAFPCLFFLECIHGDTGERSSSVHPIFLSAALMTGRMTYTLHMHLNNSPEPRSCHGGFAE